MLLCVCVYVEREKELYTRRLYVCRALDVCIMRRHRSRPEENFVSTVEFSKPRTKIRLPSIERINYDFMWFIVKTSAIRFSFRPPVDFRVVRSPDVYFYFLLDRNI